MTEGQLEIKEEKTQRAVPEPNPGSPPNRSDGQGGGVPSDTLRVEPSFSKTRTPSMLRATSEEGVAQTSETTDSNSHQKYSAV